MSGLPNLGNTCYINSIIQCLRYQRHFVRLLKNYNAEKDSKFHQYFIDLMFADASDQILRDFIFELSTHNKEFSLFKQCDAHELFLYLVDNFYEKHDLINPFEGAYESKVYCDCGYESITTQKFISLSLNIKSSTKQMLEDFQTVEELEIKCKCSKLLKKKIFINKYPSVLVIHLKRFSNGNKKIHDQVNLDAPHSFKLTGICNHSGETQSGHYTSAVLKGHGGWQMCNDIHTQELAHLPEKSRLPYILFFEKYKRKHSDIK